MAATLLDHSSSMTHSFKDSSLDARLAELPLIVDAPESERSRLIRAKLRLCCLTYDFYYPRRQLREKEAKKNALIELIEYLSNLKTAWGAEVVLEVLNCVSANLFRPVGAKRQPRLATNNEEVVDEDEPVLEESWPHVQLVYELLLRLVISKESDSKKAKENFSKRFLLQLLDLFDSEDPRERDYLKTILHRIYGKSMALRSFIRRSINDIFYTFIYETESFNGVAELLEILGSIINGFALPLKKEHQNFLEKVLIPLHKVSNLGKYHQQLSYCITQFLVKDPQTAKPVILGLLKYWPVTHSAKEVLFLNELEEIFELIQPDEFIQVMRPLFLQIARSMSNSHFQVSQRALYLWNNETLVNMVAFHRVEILPIVFGSLYKNCETHWHNSVQTLTYNVLKLFMEMDSQLFDQCSAQLEENEGKKYFNFRISKEALGCIGKIRKCFLINIP